MRKHLLLKCRTAAITVLFSSVLILLPFINPSSAAQGDTTRVSVDSAGIQAVGSSPFPDLSGSPVLSSDGRYVAFESEATNLVAGDTNGYKDIFLHDTQSGTTTRVSVDSIGIQSNGYSFNPTISSDGRYVAFSSEATNLVAADTNGVSDIFVHDTQSGGTTRVSLDSTGSQADDESHSPAISSDGRFVAFQSDATNLVANDTNGWTDIFVHDTQSGATTRVSVDSTGNQGDDESGSPAISGDGRFVAFQSDATNLVANDTNGWADIFIHETLSGATSRVSVNSAAGQGDNASYAPVISSDGRYVAFLSDAINLVAGDTNGYRDIFLRDTQSGTTTRVDVDSTGIQSNGFSNLSPAISSDGRYVSFVSDATNLVAADTNGVSDAFVHDTQNGSTTRVSISSAGDESDGGSKDTTISSDGRYVAFESLATNLVINDTNAYGDIFMHQFLPDAGNVPDPSDPSNGGGGGGCFLVILGSWESN